MRRLSDLPEVEARAALRACCGSARWVERMLSQRPFKNADEVFASAERIWWDLGSEDWLEAFAAHPRIGAQADGRTDAQHLAAGWSRHEQAGATVADEAVKAELAEANRAYEARFGFIYIVCATGKSAGEMLALCRQRLAHEPAAELRVAAEEQAKITRLRIAKLLELGT